MSNTAIMDGLIIEFAHMADAGRSYPVAKAAELYDNRSALPTNPSVGDRWVAIATANGWTNDHVYRWSGSAWTDITGTDLEIPDGKAANLKGLAESISNVVNSAFSIWGPM